MVIQAAHLRNGDALPLKSKVDLNILFSLLKKAGDGDRHYAPSSGYQK